MGTHGYIQRVPSTFFGPIIVERNRLILTDGYSSEYLFFLANSGNVPCNFVCIFAKTISFNCVLNNMITLPVL